MRRSLMLGSLVVSGLLLAEPVAVPMVYGANLLSGPKMPTEREGFKKMGKKPGIKRDGAKDRSSFQWDASIPDWVAAMERPMSVPDMKGSDRFDVENRR